MSKRFQINWANMFFLGKPCDPPQYTSHNVVVLSDVYRCIATILGAYNLDEIPEKTHIQACEAKDWCCNPNRVLGDKFDAPTFSIVVV